MSCAFAIAASSASAAPPQILESGVSEVTSTSATLEAEVNPQGAETTYHFEYGTAPCEPGPCASTPDKTIPAGSSPVHVSAEVEGLQPATIYHFRIVATNPEEAKSPDRVFATYANPLIGLPDNRAYEQSSPINKDGGDAQGDVALVKAAADGGGITFGSTFGIPGGKGAQELPFFLAKRGLGESGWASQGLRPPASFGQNAQILGWSPDFTEVFSEVTELGAPRMSALLVQSTDGSEPTEIAPYTANAKYFYAGQSADGAEVFFEANAALATGGRNGAPNLYVWDRASGEITLAGALNGPSTPSAPPKGAFAGPYDWSAGISGKTLSEGGAARDYYLQEEHAITDEGDVYFTEAGTGQLYLRLNPTQPQSAMSGEECLEDDKACTIHVSASQKTDGESENGADPAGPQPAAFQAASADGKEVFFTSPEKLTNNANTGPEQPEAAIGIGNVNTGAIENAKFIPEHAVGVAVDSKYIYWANPALGTIGRAELDGQNIEKAFISPGPVDFEVSPGVHEQVESAPRYVAVDAGHVYWTNTGRTNPENGRPLDEWGTIGRADIEGTPGSIEPAFIRGASNPQGIAVNASHIYWANAAKDSNKRTIGRADIEGTPASVEQHFFKLTGSKAPYGVALNGTHVYFNANEESDFSYVERISLEGGEEELIFIGESALRGIAVDANDVYWAAQGEEVIGRLPLADFPSVGTCEAILSCDKKFTEVKGDLNGLAVDASHLYWSVNGEAPTNPGNDLYRFVPATKELEDLTVLPGGDGAEVQGLVGAAADGSRLYLVANGDLDGPGEGETGTCETSVPHGSLSSTSGKCDLYALQSTTATFLARLDAGGGEGSDARDWVATPREVFSSGGDYAPRTAFTSKDGQTLVFRSQEKLSAYDSEGAPELYRYRVGDPAIRCLSCRPSGEAADGGPSLGQVKFPAIGPAAASVSAVTSRTMAAGGDRAFFESAEALSPEDTNGQGGCPLSGTASQDFPACLDVYEWEAPETGSCEEGGDSYSPLNEGCVYLISTGKSKFPSFFADASESGEDAFFFTRDQLVGQDQDELQDVYDARVDGGLESQNPQPVTPCGSVEACHEAPPAAPVESSPATPNFNGPGNEVQKHKKPKPRKHHKHKRHHKHKKHKKAKAKGRTGR